MCRVARREKNWNASFLDRAGRRGYSLAADHLVASGLAREHRNGRLDDAAIEAEHEVEGGFLLDVVVAQRAAVLQRYARGNEALLVRWDAFLIFPTI